MFDVQRQGNDTIPTRSQVIIPEYSFSCNGRITGYLISLAEEGNFGNRYPSVQVWHPTSPNSDTYNRVDTECALTANDINRMTDSMGNEYYLGNASCTGNSRIEFQPGDVIGYHQSFGILLRYEVWSIETMGYTSYRDSASNPLDTIDITNVDDTFDNRLPLIQVTFGKSNNTS